ncbi:MAG: 50S ribosomal protein L24 [Verrucomicrobia bacterium]|jgi:large subunit ribosomal protein L24|nr:50S ribosomal protein L24 [Verrucomicrobiota bacterium]
MPKLHVKKGDEVVVLAGSSKGSRGRIITVTGNKDRVIVEGAQMVKKHMRKSQQHPNGQILEREAAIHISNVMTATEFDKRAARHGASKAK